MSKKYRVINNGIYEKFGLKVGDIVTKIEGSFQDKLYELPKHLHGKGHTAYMFDKHLNLQERNYIYMEEYDLEEIKGE
jgi:hypothetical protein